MNKEILRTAPVVDGLPDINGRRDAVPPGLEGATILRIGTLEDYTLVEGGGLVIEYHPAGSQERLRVVLGFNERGMWVEDHKAAGP